MRRRTENYNDTDITYNVCIGVIFGFIMCIIIIVLTLVLIEITIEDNQNITIN